jgi:hypothetical protein
MEIVMRPAIVALREMGPLPAENTDGNEMFERYQHLMRSVVFPELPPIPSDATDDVKLLYLYEYLFRSIESPVTDEEARALITVFPVSPDSCFGLAWSILHAVETAPGWPLLDCLEDRENEWIERLCVRLRNAGWDL